MSKLSTAERNRLPEHAFAIPEKRAYPIHDENHARAALSMVAKYGSDEEKARVHTAVAKKFPGIGDGDAKRSRHRELDDAYDEKVRQL